MTSNLRISTWKRSIGAALLGLLLTGCKYRAPQDALKPEGPFSRKLNDLINPVFLIAAVVFILVQGLLLFTVIRYRRKSDDDSPKQIHGNWKLELTWTAIPFLILLVVGIFTIGTIFDLSKRPKGAGVVHVAVTGHQWWWEFHYPDSGVTTANVLVIPKGRAVDISLTSKDVIHNFWPPRLAGKVYAIPGRINHMTIQADHAGIFYGQCAEFCGMSHANMRLRVDAKSSADFDSWMKAQQAMPDTPVVGTAAEAGKTLFLSKGCASCHTVTDVSKGEVGPNLTHLQSRNVFAGSILQMNDENLRKWLRNPPGEKPGSRMPNLLLSEDEITKLVAYLDTLK